MRRWFLQSPDFSSANSFFNPLFRLHQADWAWFGLTVLFPDVAGHVYSLHFATWTVKAGRVERATRTIAERNQVHHQQWPYLIIQTRRTWQSPSNPSCKPSRSMMSCELSCHMFTGQFADFTPLWLMLWDLTVHQGQRFDTPHLASIECMLTLAGTVDTHMHQDLQRRCALRSETLQTRSIRPLAQQG